MKKIILITGLMISMAIHSAHAQEKIRVGQGSISLQSGLMHIAKDRGCSPNTVSLRRRFTFPAARPIFMS